MKYFTFLLCITTSMFCLHGKTIADLEFGTDSTFDVITWNIEHFPNKGASTVADVKALILALDAEVIAVQEVDDTAAFTQMLGDIDGYDGFYGNWYYIACGFIYNSDVVTLNSKEELFYGDFTNFPRPAYLIDVTYQGVQYYIINNHYKCCDGGESRRSTANQMLKDYIDVNLANANVIVLGDFNDELVDEENVFDVFINDADNYRFSDMAIAEGASSGWSYPSWPSQLDHILITNELFKDTPAAEVIQLDDYYSSSTYYSSNISDHLPVGITIAHNVPTGIVQNSSKQHLSVYPNPVVAELTVELPKFIGQSRLDISDNTGRILTSQIVTSSFHTLIVNTNDLPSGILFVELFTPEAVYTAKLVKE